MGLVCLLAIDAPLNLSAADSAPLILAYPQSQTVLAGTNVSFQVLAEGTAPLSYQWRKESSPLPGRTTSALELIAVTTNSIGSYDVVVSNSAGAVTSTPPAILTVLVPPYVIQPPQSVAVLEGDTARFEVLAGGTGPLAYQWRKNALPIPGRTDASLWFLSVSAEDVGSYDAIVNNPVGGITSAPPAALSVLRPPAIVLQPTNISRAVGSPGAFRVTVEGDRPLSYQWLKNGTRVAWATNSFLSLSSVEFADRGSYRVIVTNVLGSVISSVADLTVTCPQLTIEPLTLPMAGVGSEYRCTLSARGGEGPYAYSIIGTLPPGLVYSTDVDGLVLHGTPSLDGSASFDVLATDTNNCTAIRNYTITIDRVPDAQFKTALCRAVCGTNCSSTDNLEFHGLTNLWAASYGISNLSGLEMATNLTELHLENNAIADLTPLRSLYGLTRLNLAHNSVADLSPLAGLTNLIWLDLSGNPLVDCSPVSNLVHLRSLLINDGLITNLQFVDPLNLLEELQLHDNRFQDISPLGQLPNLIWLDLRWNYITNHAVLSGATNLTRLYLGGTSLTNLQFLAPLSRLTLLNLEQNAVQNISPLTGLTNLAYLALSGNPVATYSPIASLSNLVNLELRGNLITNLAIVAGLPRLSYADLAYNAITDVSSLAGRTNLSLVLDGNPKVDLSRLALLTNVTELWLNGNGLSNVSALAVMPQLTALGLEGNCISNIQPLSALTNLQHLALSRNPATNLGLVTAFTNLTGLRIEGNSITNARFLSRLKHLRFLSINSNRIDVAALANLKELTSLYCANNRLTNIAALTNLPGLAFGDVSQNLLNTGPGTAASNTLSELRSRAVAVEGASVKFLPQDRLRISVSPEAAPDWYIVPNRPSDFTCSVWSDLVPGNELILEANSSNPALLPVPGITVTGANERHLVVTPSAVGNVTLTLTLKDAPAGLSLSSNLFVHVLPADPSFAVPDRSLSNLLCSALGRPEGITSVDMLNLAQFWAVNAQITNLSGLQWARNLRTLYLGGNTITDLAPLSTLTRLTLLTLDNNDSLITDVEVLAGLTNLNILDLSGNALTELPPLWSLTQLDRLFIEQNRLKDITGLLDLPSLSYVDVRLNLLGANQDALLEALWDRDVEVAFTPQRGPPTIDVRTNWVVAPDTSSSLTFSIFDTGPAHQHFAFGTDFPPPELSGGLNSLDEFNRLWSLEIIPRVDNTTTFISLSATHDVGYYSNATIALVITPLLPLQTVLPPPQTAWTNESPKAWFGQEIVTRNGRPTAQSGAIDNAQSSSLQTTLEGPGRLTFWWKVSSQTNADWLEFMSSVQTNMISGEVDWQQLVAYLPAGWQTVTWSYRKDETFSVGFDAAWLSDVTFEPGAWLEVLDAPTNGQCHIILHVIPQTLYGVLVATNLASGVDPSSWQLLAPLVLATDSSMPFTDTNAVVLPPGGNDPQVRFYRLREMPRLGFLSITIPQQGAVELLVQNGYGQGFRLEASPDLSTWSTVTTYLGSKARVLVWDTLHTNWPSRFYRAVQLPLDLPLPVGGAAVRHAPREASLAR